MTFFSNVAPRRKVKPAPKPWECDCRLWKVNGLVYASTSPLREHAAHITRCPDCGAERP